MVISFEEKDREVIESRGMMLIEFKKRLYDMEKTMGDAWNVLKEVAYKIGYALGILIDKFLEAVDSLKMVFESIKDMNGKHTSFRYKIVKFLSKCTKIDMWKLWKMTRNTWLARSCI